MEYFINSIVRPEPSYSSIKYHSSKQNNILFIDSICTFAIKIWKAELNIYLTKTISFVFA